MFPIAGNGFFLFLGHVYRLIGASHQTARTWSRLLSAGARLLSRVALHGGDHDVSARVSDCDEISVSAHLRLLPSDKDPPCKRGVRWGRGREEREFKRGEPPQMRYAQLLGEGEESWGALTQGQSHSCRHPCSSLSPRRVSPLVTSM